MEYSLFSFMVVETEDKGNLNFISSERFISDGIFQGGVIPLKTHAPQSLFFWKRGVNEYSQKSILSLTFGKVGFSTP